MKTLDELLAASAALHRHLCPRQVLGVQMGRLAAELLQLELPQSDKRLLTIVETDGCFSTGVSVATNCWVGRRTLRVEDYGKVAATFVDTKSGQAIRIAPSPTARERAAAFAPEARNRWEAMLLGYQRMALADLFVWRPVILTTPVEAILSRAGHRAMCDSCGEEIINEREVVIGDVTLCRHCAYGGYYRLCEEGAGVALPLEQWTLQSTL
ncbi:FmdE family protein [Caldilinea sp.]|jgi:formylmethanofuran dehydrogenase subunit E|uniref:FmdE family protein n=1 Tax=Caldilinea sp. TaxID=2293560 RepID=UPI0021DEDE40|nr:FmdE family protein [Caldilinea sp.]GIV69188.1 MAG: formylmethanofuran dehydrogenase subunit E [Caldilinea sp.]GIV71328.1 MAG: formylmethanofuran dehydrogenase subunit E [Caldilinea sp.]